VHDRARGLGDVVFRRARPQIVDLVGARSAQLLGPAAVVEEQQPAAIVQHGFVSRRHRDPTRVDAAADRVWDLRPAANITTDRDGRAPGVSVLADVSAGHDTNHAVHR